MILRLSQKLNARLKGGPLEVVPAHENPLLDCSAHVVAVARAEYALLINTTTLYFNAFNCCSSMSLTSPR